MQENETTPSVVERLLVVGTLYTIIAILIAQLLVRPAWAMLTG